MNLKEGLEYFPVDCVTDDKLELVTAEFGLQAFAIVIKLFQKIYGEHGYYCEWNREVCLLFAKNNGLGCKSVSRINEIVSSCLRRGVFSFEQYEKNGILTSEDIQKKFLNGAKRRKVVKMKEAYLLIKVTLLPDNVSIIPQNVYILSENVDVLKQSKVKEKKITNYLSDEKPDSFSKILNFATENGICEDVAKKFFEYYEKTNWHSKNGTKIQDWKASLIYWGKSEKSKKSEGKYEKNGKKNSFCSFNQRQMSVQQMDELEKKLLEN